MFSMCSEHNYISHFAGFLPQTVLFTEQENKNKISNVYQSCLLWHFKTNQIYIPLTVNAEIKQNPLAKGMLPHGLINIHIYFSKTYIFTLNLWVVILTYGTAEEIQFCNDEIFAHHWDLYSCVFQDQRKAMQKRTKLQGKKQIDKMWKSEALYSIIISQYLMP